MLLRVNVKPNSRVDKLSTLADGTILIKIKAPPIEGRANEYLIAFIANHLSLPKSKVVLIKGANNPYKTLEIDAPEDYVLARMAQ